MPHVVHPLDVGERATTEYAPGDPTPYHVWQALTGNGEGVRQGKYLVDDNGQPKYLVDPAINGVVKQRDNGTPVQKFDAPKTVPMVLLTEGILTQKLSWTLVLMGVAIVLVLELSGVPSLPFAVGVYLPLCSLTPIFVGGLVRDLATVRAGSPRARCRPRRRARWVPACCCPRATSRAGPSAPCSSRSCRSATRFRGS